MLPRGKKKDSKARVCFIPHETIGFPYLAKPCSRPSANKSQVHKLREYTISRPVFHRVDRRGKSLRNLLGKARPKGNNGSRRK